MSVLHWKCKGENFLLNLLGKFLMKMFFLNFNFMTSAIILLNYKHNFFNFNFLLLFLIFLIFVYWNNFLMILIIFEMMMISIFFEFFFNFFQFYFSCNLIFSFIVFSVSEACLGLSVLIFTSRFKGSSNSSMIY